MYFWVWEIDKNEIKLTWTTGWLASVEGKRISDHSFSKYLEILWKYFWNTLEILWKYFENTLEILWKPPVNYSCNESQATMCPRKHCFHLWHTHTLNIFWLNAPCWSNFLFIKSFFLFFQNVFLVNYQPCPPSPLLLSIVDQRKAPPQVTQNRTWWRYQILDIWWNWDVDRKLKIKKSW